MRFILVDRVLRMEAGKEAVVRKNVSNSEDFFTDHFAGRPIMPGCLILEACDQASRLLLGCGADFRSLATLEKVANVKFQHFVQPGDCLEIHSVVVSQSAEAAEVRVSASTEGRAVAGATLTYQLHQASEDPGIDRACARMREFHEILTSDPVSAAWENRMQAMRLREASGA
ncbi:MAG TPA: 3-hydroxyacyl-ACP dehydratase FabZ family protein [Candidatus Sulfotelmatobacter sp.]|nr:3-hydroxyacyl-ACP dehydratase FabZ family protein [Candidatus Sulfotelmatobacter sp.]